MWSNIERHRLIFIYFFLIKEVIVMASYVVNTFLCPFIWLLAVLQFLGSVLFHQCCSSLPMYFSDNICSTFYVSGILTLAKKD